MQLFMMLAINNEQLIMLAMIVDKKSNWAMVSYYSEKKNILETA